MRTVSEQQTPELDLNEILKVRREKLKELQEQGCDPFRQVKYDRDHMAAQVKEDLNRWKAKRCQWQDG